MEAIYKRRSIRKYLDKPVSKELIDQFIKAGMNAPSAGNEMPWQFIVIDDRKILNEIMKIHPHSKMLKEAPVAILVCGDLEKETHEGYWVQDCAACTQNILLAIADKDLGGVWLGVYPRENRAAEIKKLLNLPGPIIPFSIIAVGYPNENKPLKNEFDQSLIHYNNW